MSPSSRVRRVKASELRENAANWRRHPESQRRALGGVLAEIGYVDALIARETENGELELLDGHLRRDLTPDMEVPVLVVDLDDSEAATVLATLDPLSAMAEADEQKLGELLAGLEAEDEAVQEMLEELTEEHKVDVFRPEALEDSFAGIAARERGESGVTFVFSVEEADQVRKAVRKDGMEYWAAKIVGAVNDAAMF